MNVAVCIAPVTDPASVTFDIETERIRGGAIQGNPLDWTALAGGLAYLRTAEHEGVGPGDLIAVSVGGPDADAVLQGALVRGADRAVRVATFGDTDDPTAIARALARVIGDLDCDLVLCGARSADFGSEIVGTALARELARPSVSRTVEMEPAGPDRLRVAWKVEGGRREIYVLPLPAVVSVEEELADPSYVPILSRQYRAGLNKTVEVIEADTPPDKNAFVHTFVQAKPRTKHIAAPTSYIGAVSADPSNPSAILEFTEENATRFLKQLGQWT
jgi:electron transfer flavoprotein beta subunit